MVNALTVCPKTSWPGFYPTSLCNYYHETKLVDAIEEVQSWNDYLLTVRGSALSKVHYNLLTVPSISMESQIDIGGGNLVVKENLYGLWNGVKQFVAAARVVADLDINQITTSEQNTFFVIVNGDIEGIYLNWKI